MAAHHYVSKFHLRGFCDPNSVSTRDPWLWVGDLSDGSVRRRSPKNVGTVPDLFAGPGGLAGANATIENFLANEVEGPASFALREMCAVGPGTLGSLPAPLMRYLAWAASRSLPMQRLEIEWGTRFGAASGPMAEPPPDGLLQGLNRHREVRMIHPTLGDTIVPEGDDPSALFDVGWIPDPTEQSNFLEGIHVQAYYFQVRWFPRLQWFTLRPPSDQFFIIGDRPVGWGVPGCLDAPPCCLRDPSAFLIAPLSYNLALVGRNSVEPWRIRPVQVNAILAAWSHEWIAGPTSDCVAEAIQNREELWGPTNPALEPPALM